MKTTTRHGIAITSALLLIAACDQAQNLGDGSDPSTGPDAGTNDGATGGHATDTGLERDAASDTGLTPPDAGAPSSCAGNVPCDPLANTGCAAAQTCQVSWTDNDSAAACKTTISQSSQVFGKACPCAAGLTCFSAIGICYRVCDPKHGTPVLDGAGKPIPGVMNDNPECLADPEAERNGYTTCHKIGSCFGVCDRLAELP
jgi:hypothetical protein